VIKTPELLAELSLKRPIFHSEADFQHALAWKIHSKHPELSIRLERVFRNDNGNMNIDLFIIGNKYNLAMELKYKTRAISVGKNDEKFILAGQAAQDLGRYDFIKDIQRLEFLKNQHGVKGTAIFLTNDSAYWKPAKSLDVGYAEFCINEGIYLKGCLNWGPRAGDGTRKGREKAINLVGSYPLNWRDYSLVNSDRGGQFRYVFIEVL